VPAKSEPTATAEPTDDDPSFLVEKPNTAKGRSKVEPNDVPSTDPAPPARSGALVAAVLAAGVFAFAAVVLLLFLVHEKDQADKLGAEQTDVSNVQLTATQVAENIARWDKAGNAAQRETLQRLTNGPVLSQYDGAIEGLNAAMPALGATSVRATVQEVYVGPIDGDEVQVVVVVDLEVAGTNPHTVPNHYLRVHLSRIAGTWKVDDVKDVNTALAASGTATPTTTVPTGDAGGATTTVPDTSPTTAPQGTATTTPN
jgi:hypothetical protein